VYTELLVRILEKSADIKIDRWYDNTKVRGE
jgi:hypothetical protein